MRKTIYPGERQALAIRCASAAADNIGSLSNRLAEHFDAVDKALREIISTDADPTLAQLLDRINELRFLRNQMELGSFTIRLKHALDSAYQRLP